MQQPDRALRLAHHAGGLGAAFQDECGIRPGGVRQPQGVHRLGMGGDELRAEGGLAGIGGEQEATWAMAALSRRARSSGVSVTGGGSEPRRVWMSCQ